MKTNKAPAEYAKAADRVSDLMTRLQSHLTAHAAKQAADPSNYGFVGDMNHYADLLEEILGVEYRVEQDGPRADRVVIRKSDGASIVIMADEASTDEAAIAAAKRASESCWG